MGIFNQLLSSRKDKAKSQEQQLLRPNTQGGSAVSIWSGQIMERESNTECSLSRWTGTPHIQGVASKMYRTDAHVRSSLSMLVNPLLSCTWDVAPASNDEVDVEVADFVKYCLMQSEINFEAYVKRCVLSYATDGVALFEWTDDVRPIPAERFPNHPSNGKGLGILPTGLHYRPAYSVDRWNQRASDPTSLKSVTQHITGSDTQKSKDVTISGKRLLRWTWEPEAPANFVGQSILRSAYPAWKLKRMLMVCLAIRNERLSNPIPSLTMPTDVTEAEIEQATDILRNLKSNESSFLLLPNSFEFDFKGITAGDGTALTEAIRYCDLSIFVNVLGAFSLLGQGSPGSYALSASQQHEFALSIETHAKTIAARWNHKQDGWCPIERIVKMNYGDRQLPRLTYRATPMRDYTKILPVLSGLAQWNLIQADDRLESHIRAILHLPEKEDGSARVAPESPAEEESHEQEIE
tara:strand:- start:981 stop:2375 length:1395 start_codon:yes stop_codon:yes gene_type:complete